MPTPPSSPRSAAPSPLAIHRRRIVAGAGAATLVALLAAVLSVYRVGLLPPKLESKDLAVGVATAHAIVGPKLDRGDVTDVDELTDTTDVDTRTDRGELVANLLTSTTVVDRIGLRIGIAPSEIAAATQITASIPDALTEPGFDVRAAQILAAGGSYRLDVQANPAIPIVDLYARGPTAADAARLAEAAIAAGNAFLRDRAGERGSKAGAGAGIRLRRLGAPAAATAGPHAAIEVAALVFAVAFAIAAGGLLLIVVLRRGWRSRGGGAGSVVVRFPFAGHYKRIAAADRPRPAPADAEPVGGAWPHTTRILPWMLAGFMALLWLVPFNGIAIDASLPIDLKLDRIVLPAIVLLWVLAIAAGGSGAPSRRVTPIHAAIAAFVAVAFLSVVFNATALSENLTFDLAVKKLSLLVAYASVFVVVASVVRRDELRAFLKLNLVLAALCAIGVLWEYRFGFNVFYEAAAQLLPRIFDVQIAPSGFDELGRRSVSGPTDHSLEVVAILSMALPIALVGMIKARDLRGRIPYLLAACLIGAAIISTYRKSGFLAPVAALVTIAWLARRQALRLAPLAIVALLVLPLTSFSAFGSIADQFNSDKLGVPTVGDRVSDYDAVRPDILSHPALGRGFGSYEHTSGPTEARILDSDLLLRTVETGIIGLLAFLLMIVTVIAVAVAQVRARGPRGAPVAIVVAAAAAAFLLLTALFDEWSFPHAPYLFMTLAGLLAVSTAAPIRTAAGPPGAARRGDRAEPAGREKRVATSVSLEDVRHHRTGPAAAESGRSGAAGTDVRPARAPGA